MKRIKLQLGEKDNPLKTRRLRRVIKKFIPFFLIVALLLSLAIFLVTLSGSSSVVNLIFKGTILKSQGGRVNVLLLGSAGGAHAGANLTDTIMVASYNLKTSEVHLISIPRDLWLPSLQSKANAVYEIGRSENDSLGLAKTVVGNILGLPVHYALRVDFSGFVKAIDTLEGIDLTVDRSFDDSNYPIEGREDDLCGFKEQEIDFSNDEAKKLNIEPGKRLVLVKDGQIATDSADPKKGPIYFSCRFEYIAFKKGATHMDGKTALKFVRSRAGSSGEGSDFARSKRQQKVLEAVRGKILSYEVLTSPDKISQVLQTFGKSIDTDISIQDALEFYRLVKKTDKTYSFVLDDSQKSGLPEGRTKLLFAPSPSDYGGAYVLVSQDDDFAIIQQYIRKILSGEVKEDEATSAARGSNR